MLRLLSHWPAADNGTNSRILARCFRTIRRVLLSPPGVFGRVETGQVFVLFDDIHLFTGPEQKIK